MKKHNNALLYLYFSFMFRNLICLADWGSSKVCKDFMGNEVCRDPVTGVVLHEDVSADGASASETTVAASASAPAAPGSIIELAPAALEAVSLGSQ